jgi:serine/threonine protein kinase
MTRNPVQFTDVSGVAAEVGSTANNYQILARLATGGMAEIFLARGTSTTGVERYVVLKRILRDRANDVQLVKMFLDEARLAAQLNHPNVAQVYDIGKLGDSYFFTMEYVHGETVRALLHRARSLRRDVPNNVILTVIAGAASGLHHAHSRLGHDGKPLGIVHRDVSPSNLMVSYEGGVKVVDFGVAKAENRAQETRSGTVKGKIAYLSPEQCRGGAVDRRSDVFSLGIVFWELLTIERLYKRQSDFENMTAIVTEEPPPPSSRRPGIAPELDHIVLKMLSKDPDRRYQSADELVDALEDASPKLGAMISTSAVSRLLRDMFGQRPEPWLEMDSTTIESQEEQPEPGVTVTSEPIPRELASQPAQQIDAMLARVRDLGARAPTDSGTVPPPGLARSQMLTAQALPAQVAAMDTLRASWVPPTPASGLPQQRGSGAVPPLEHTRHGTGAVPPIVGGPMHDRSGPIVPVPQVPESFSPTGSSSGEHAYPSNVQPTFQGAGSSSGAHAYPSGSHANYPVLSAAHGQHDALPAPQRRWTLIAIVAIAAVLGSLTVWFVMRGSGSSTTPDAAAVVALADAAVASEPTVVPAEPDAAPVVVTPDAPEVTPDAAAVVADAAPVVVVADAPQQDPLLVAFEDKRYSEVVATCTRTFTADHTVTCTLAACRTKQDVRAQRWFAKITNAGAKRSVAASCREAGVDVTPKLVRPPQTKPDAGVVDPCAANPMACQR